MPVPHYPSDEPDKEDSAPDIDNIIHRIIDGDGGEERTPSPSLGS